MANTNKISFAVSVTPKILMDAADGVNQEIEVINENTPFEINKISNASIIMLENIRFNEGEESNDREFGFLYCEKTKKTGRIR